MSKQRKWVITTITVVTWLICTILLLQNDMFPRSMLFFTTFLFGVILATVHAA